MRELSKRRKFSAARTKVLCKRLKPSENIVAGKASVFATGSYGRCEASNHSDLDLFIVGKKNGVKGPQGKEGSLLSHLDEIRIMADLIEVTRDLNFPEFSDDGRYVVHYSVHDFTKTLGTPEDDVTNTFTARLLLLLESCPLMEETVYQEVVQEVIESYWRDFADHKPNFMPAFLANDILRLWRTFCVNYEARTKRFPKEKKTKGKLKNYKLKHSRMLTCYSALLYLLAIYGQKNTVNTEDALEMIKLTPTERLEWLAAQSHLKSAHNTINNLLGQYESFLKTTNSKESELLDLFLDKNESHKLMSASFKFGDSIYEALNQIGNGNSFHRLLVV